MTTERELRQAIANLASSQEHSKDSALYWKEVLVDDWQGPYPKHWCGAFALWCLRAVLRCPWKWKIWREGENSGFLFRLPKTTDPDLGDICYMDAPFQHHAVVTAAGINAAGVPYIISQDGNQGPSPGECFEKWRPKSAWTAFYSIKPLIDAYLEREKNDENK